MSEKEKFYEHFNLKVIAINEPDLASTLLAVVKKIHDNCEVNKKSPSQQGQYLALTISIQDIEQSQLDEIYQQLHKHPWTKWVL